MKKIPFSRALIYLIILGLTPLFAIGCYYVKQKNTWGSVLAHMDSTIHQAQVKAARQSINTAVRKKYDNADIHYLERLENLTFLNKEKEALETLFSSRSFTGNESAEKRYAFLSSNNNRLQFTSKDVQKQDKIYETVEILTHPIEVDHIDLRKILSLIEETQPKQPQLLITDFKLTKLAKTDGNEVFELNFAFVKREFEK